jgi:hypothetical protein
VLASNPWLLYATLPLAAASARRRLKELFVSVLSVTV